MGTQLLQEVGDARRLAPAAHGPRPRQVERAGLAAGLAALAALDRPGNAGGEVDVDLLPLRFDRQEPDLRRDAEEVVDPPEDPGARDARARPQVVGPPRPPLIPE